MKRTIPFLILLMLSACRPYTPPHRIPPTNIEASYDRDLTGEVPVNRNWWETFSDPELNRIVEKARTQNLLLDQSMWRIARACYELKMERAAKIPEITGLGTVTRFRTNETTLDVTGGTAALVTDGSSTNYIFQHSLNYEIDLWRRIDSLTKARAAHFVATQEDFLAAELLIQGAVVEQFFELKKNQHLLALINHQIEVSRTQLELIELRFGVGVSSALEVYQQRLQLSQIQSQLPQVAAAAEVAENALNTLLGEVGGVRGMLSFSELPQLPELPVIGNPVDLICQRPDLRAAYHRLAAADYDVAVAMAERLPRLDIAITHQFLGNTPKNLFDGQVSRMVASLMTPLLDGGRRVARVHRQKAIVYDQLYGYGNAFLSAVEEVSDAVSREVHQIELIQLLENQITIAEKNLEESRIHYINGLNDYLTVIAALQSQQNLERRLVEEKVHLLINRSVLYRALGGGV